MNFVQILFEFCTNFVQTLYEFSINFVWILYKFCMNFALILYEFCTNFAQILYKFVRKMWVQATGPDLISEASRTPSPFLSKTLKASLSSLSGSLLSRYTLANCTNSLNSMYPLPRHTQTNNKWPRDTLTTLHSFVGVLELQNTVAVKSLATAVFSWTTDFLLVFFIFVKNFEPGWVLLY